MIPACGPPNSLSPLKQTRSAPAFNSSAAVGSCSAIPNDSVANMAPLPRSSTNAIRFFRASALISFEEGDSTKPLMKKLLRCTLRIIAVSGPMACSIIVERCLVGCADFAQFRAARFENFADAKPATDLHQFTA